jgi:hypothetical protein
MNDDELDEVSAETLLTYAGILEKPQRDAKGAIIPTGEIVEAACAALRRVAAMKGAAI